MSGSTSTSPVSDACSCSLSTTSDAPVCGARSDCARSASRLRHEERRTPSRQPPAPRSQLACNDRSLATPGIRQESPAATVSVAARPAIRSLARRTQCAMFAASRATRPIRPSATVITCDPPTIFLIVLVRGASPPIRLPSTRQTLCNWAQFGGVFSRSAVSATIFADLDPSRSDRRQEPINRRRVVSPLTVRQSAWFEIAIKPSNALHGDSDLRCDVERVHDPDVIRVYLSV